MHRGKLITGIVHIVIALILAQFIGGCASSSTLGGVAMSNNAVCRHKALMACSVMQEHCPAYILVGKTGDVRNGVEQRHAQAVVFLRVIGDRVEFGPMDCPLSDIKIYTWREFVNYMDTLRVVPVQSDRQ